MNLLRTRFVREFATVVIGTLFLVANYAFIFIPAALGRIPG